MSKARGVALISFNDAFSKHIPLHTASRANEFEGKWSLTTWKTHRRSGGITLVRADHLVAAAFRRRAVTVGL